MEDVHPAQSAVDILSSQERLTIVTLCFINLLNWMDRFSIAGILLYVQAYFNIEDDHAGVIHSAYVIGYIAVSPLVGFLGDRYSRKYLIIMLVVIWSTMGYANTMVDDIALFIGTRVFVGSCQAGFNIIAPSLLSDIVVGRKRISVFGIFFLAAPVGTGLSLIVTPKINHLTKGLWWWGLRPIPIALCFCFVSLFFSTDPLRGVKDAALLGGKPAQRTSYKEDILDIMTTKSFLLIVVAISFASFLAAAFGWWRPKSLGYGYILIKGEEGKNESKVVGIFGFISIVSGLLGVTLGSGLSRALRPKYSFVDPLICGTGMFIALPFNLITNYATPINMDLTLFFSFFAQAAMSSIWAVSTDMMMYVVMPMRRASAKAIETFLSHMIGNLNGGVLVGAISEFFQAKKDFSTWHDHVTRNDSTINYEKVADEFYGLQYALYCVMSAFLFSAIFFFLIVFYITEDKQNAATKSIAKE